MKTPKLFICGTSVIAVAIAITSLPPVQAQVAPPPDHPSGYAKVDITEDFAVTMAGMQAARAAIMQRQLDLLEARYDLANRPAPGVTMFRGKPVQEGFDLPNHFLPEFPAPIFLTTHPEMGDVSHGKLLTIDNFHQMYNGVLNPKQLEGLRLLLTPFPQQQFNQTEDRRTERPSRGVTCFDCHANGHGNGATHLAGDARPQELRHRIETPSLRGVNVQRLFGSQRALKTVEDFTEFEQRAAYFDGDPLTATKKGVNPLERGSQVHFMAEFQELLDFPPAPKLTVTGKLDPKLATAAELRGQAVFNGKGQCVSCHAPPYYSDNLMHNLKTERFFKPQTVNGIKAVGDGPIKTFQLRGIKESPPYLHDGRLLTLEDTAEFFNLVLETHLSSQEKSDLVAFLRTL